MNSSMIFGLVIIGAIVYWLIGFVHGLDEEVDVSYGYNEKRLVGGEELLMNGSLSLNENKKLWANSTLKQEMIGLFPNFSEMNYLVEDKVGETGQFKKELLTHIDKIQKEFMSGKISASLAKEKLGNY